MNIINWWALDIHWAFRAIKEYAERMEEQILRMAQEDRERIQADPPDEEESSNVWGQHDWLFEETLPRSLRYSCVSLLLTTIETTLAQICREFEKKRKLPLTLGDLAGRPPEKMLAYIHKAGGVSLPVLPFRATLGHLVNIRHCITHAAGNVELSRSPSPKAVREAARQIEGFSVSPDSYVEIEPGVCTRLIEEAAVWEQEILNATGLAFRGERSTAKKP